jgi:invasion protein IalB
MQSLQSLPRNIAGVFAVACAAAMAGAAAAQQPGRPLAARSAPQNLAWHEVQAAPPSNEPQRTSATYAGWVVQCESAAGRTPPKLCEMAQLTEVRGKNVPFSRVALSYSGRGKPVRLTVQVPVNVSFASQVRIQTSDSDPGIVAPFARCVPGGCFADFELKDGELMKFRAAHGSGKVSFADSGGHSVTVPLLFNGFSEAFDALARE